MDAGLQHPYAGWESLSIVRCIKSYRERLFSSMPERFVQRPAAPFAATGSLCLSHLELAGPCLVALARARDCGGLCSEFPINHHCPINQEKGVEA
jgi:hypothetical protein